MAENERGWLGKAWDYLKDRVAPEIGDMVVQKIAQGSAEIGQAINSSADGYVPYGTGQQPLEVEGPMQSYQDMLRDAAQRGQQEQDREIER